MTTLPARRTGRSQTGLAGGCLLGVAVLVALAVAAGALLWSALAAPDLGVAPRGPLDGGDAAAIAARLAPSLAEQLVRGEHAVVTLSEQDMTALAAQRNPDSQRIQDPHVRARGGLVVIDARTDLGPLQVTAVGRLALALTRGADGVPAIAATIDEIDAGRLELPGFLRDALEQRIRAAVNLDDVLSADPRLEALRPYLDCVAVVDSGAAPGVRLGFHRPGASAAPGVCA